MINESIAHYKITSKLGQGGMGEVYRATDTKLDREVAIKILPESFVGNAERVGRFRREAKALAALNHPNIAVIHGIEQADDRQALVMELVEGETLGERLKREPMTVEEALACGKQIAEALEAAHEKGIVHRDLKPENIKVSEDGHVKVLDFGLAKELIDPTAADEQGEFPTITQLTTMSGELLGTAPYMSPEQARARPVDRRSDIWSFGCVLYECLTGQAMFGGEDVTETLATVLKSEPDWSRLPGDTPPTIALLLRKCLNKDRRRRLQHIGDARVDLEHALGDPSGSTLRISGHALDEVTTSARRPWMFTLGAMILASLVTAMLGQLFKAKPIPREWTPIRKLSVDVGITGKIFDNVGSAVQLSPDGTTLAFIGEVEDGTGSLETELYLRRLDHLEPVELAAAVGVSQFCFSPDGRHIVCKRDITRGGSQTLEKVSVTGGAAITLADACSPWGMSWGDDGWVVFVPHSGGALYRVSSAGGTVEPLTTLSGDDVTHRWPQVLPGSEAVLFTAHRNHRLFDNANIMVQRMSGGDAQLVWQGGHHAQYLPSGHLIFVRNETLFAAAFDLKALELRGTPVPVLEGVRASKHGGAHAHVSADGTLAYLADDLQEALYVPAWMDREGYAQPLSLRSTNVQMFSLSPKGKALARVLGEQGAQDIWIDDLERGTSMRLTFAPGNNIFPIWSPNGDTIVFSSTRDGGVPNLYWKRADGSGDAHRLTTSSNVQFASSWHPSGNYLAVTKYVHTDETSDIRLLELSGDAQAGWKAGEITDIVASPFTEQNASFSPDGRWLAYRSNESGQRRIYVQRFPGGGGKRQVSIGEDDSYSPEWSSSTSELFFLTEASARSLQGYRLFVAPYTLENDTFISERPVPWNDEFLEIDAYALHPDGSRILYHHRVAEEQGQGHNHVILFENFLDYLREHVPIAGLVPRVGSYGNREEF